jgi:hypothetical protein
MREVLRTNDPVLLSYARHRLAEEGVESFVFDQNISALEGSICAFPRRLMVADDSINAARAALMDIREHLTQT